MYDLKQIIEGDEDLWIGNALSPTNWPDICAAIRKSEEELLAALDSKNIDRVKKANRWIKSIYFVIEATVSNIQEEG